ncbi:MAG TPA: biotin/lipoyl-containing protein, partial [Vicinamibacterales bacterium]|nr:biotin/lipoyl-containing protein [Vicinamibacterales bacterium]
MAIELRVPPVGESVTSVEIGKWLKAEGEAVAKDETVAVIDSEKATVEVPAPAAGRLSKIVKHQGESAEIGEVIGEIDERATASPPAKTKAATAPAPAAASAPAVAPPPPPPPTTPRIEPSSAPPQISAERSEEVVRMTMWRRTIARRLVEAKQETALLTTFNEIDMTAVADLRKTWGEAFQKKHGVKL